MKQVPTRLFLITGFLGSGKTTVLNAILASIGDLRVGVIVNEWGKIGVDGSLLRDPSGIGVVEVAGGQIFCACVSGSFLDAVARLVDVSVDLILVETSGLAKPSALRQLVSAAAERAHGALSYAGMLCVVDAVRFLTLRQVAAAVDEQVFYSDRFVITKTEIAGVDQTAAVRAVLREIKGEVPVAVAVDGAVDASLLGIATMGGGEVAPQPIRGPEPRFAGWGPSGRPGSTSLRAVGPVDAAALAAFLAEIADDTYRMKGFVSVVEAGSVRRALVDCVGDQVAIRTALPDPAREPVDGLVIIWKGVPRESGGLADLWQARTGVGAEVR